MGVGPTLKNPTRADVSMSSGVLDMKNIEAAVIATAVEHISTMVLRQCMASISLPQKTAASVTARFDKNTAIGTSLTCPPSGSMYIGIMIERPLQLAFMGTRYHDQLRLARDGESCNKDLLLYAFIEISYKIYLT
jgi:hypothetical protein